MSVLPEQISTFDYYVKKLPFYLQRSESFLQHFRIWYDLLIGESSTSGTRGFCDTLLNLLNVFDKDFLNRIASLEGSGSVGTYGQYTSYGFYSDILDKIGALFGIKRRMTITYVDSGTTHYNEEIFLNNEDFLIFIKFQIVKNNCEGTREQIEEFYKSTGLIIYMVNQATSENVNLYLPERSNTSSDLKKLFLSGNLLIDSMGVKYSYTSLNFNNLLYWDQINSSNTNGWGNDAGTTGGLLTI